MVFKPNQPTSFVINDQEDDHSQSRSGKTLPTPSEKALIGKVVAGKYHVVSFIGRGGMSVVYKARHLLLDKDVAIKVLRSHLLTDQESIERFKVEAQAVSALNSKHIIKTHGFDLTDDGRPFLVVELLIGPTLADIVESHPEGTPPDEVIDWFCQIATGLKEAHEQGVIHRDLKPSNIALDEADENTAKIFDFGIAKVLYGEGNKQSKLTQTGDVFGSPMYMSPEQARGEKLDARSDIYSFGCLMYELLTGTPPIVGQNIFDMLRKQMSEDPPDVSAMAPAVSESLNYVVMRCLSKTPSLRYQSARHLLSDLMCVKEHRKIPRELKKVSHHASAQAIRQRDETPSKGNLQETVRMGFVVISFLCLLGFLSAGAVSWWTALKSWEPPLKSWEPPPDIESPLKINPNEEYENVKKVAMSYYTNCQYENALPLLQYCLKDRKTKPRNGSEFVDSKGQLHSKNCSCADDHGRTREELEEIGMLTRYISHCRTVLNYRKTNDASPEKD